MKLCGKRFELLLNDTHRQLAIPPQDNEGVAGFWLATTLFAILYELDGREGFGHFRSVRVGVSHGEHHRVFQVPVFYGPAGVFAIAAEIFWQPEFP